MRSIGRFRPGRNDARQPVSAVCELINGGAGVGDWAAWFPASGKAPSAMGPRRLRDGTVTAGRSLCDSGAPAPSASQSPPTFRTPPHARSERLPPLGRIRTPGERTSPRARDPAGAARSPGGAVDAVRCGQPKSGIGWSGARVAAMRWAMVWALWPAWAVGPFVVETAMARRFAGR